MNRMLTGKTILITGSARRIGREFALAVAREGADVIIHHSNSTEDAKETAQEVILVGGQAEIVQADFSDPIQAAKTFNHIFASKKIHALVNNAAIFQAVKFKETSFDDWEKHLKINLTMPFLLSQMFVKALAGESGRIVNILDWRALRPGRDHFPYTISKTALVGLTKSLAYSLAPAIQVNGIALGAILPPADGNKDDNIIGRVPAKRWATMKELTDTLLFLLNGPEYITGEIIHLDGGRHLV